MKYKLVLLFSMLILSRSSFSEVYKWTDPKGIVHYSDQPFLEASSDKTHKNKPSLIPKKPVSSEPTGNLITNNVIQIRNLINTSSFDKLNNLLFELNKKYSNNEITEQTLITAYTGFDIKDPSYQEFFDRWIKSSPSIFQPYLASAVYQYYLGWHLRGNSYRSKTKEEKLINFERKLNESKENIGISLHLNSKSLIAYYYKMNIAVSLGAKQDIALIKDEALKLDRTSYYIRSLYLKSLTPRWGGSFDIIQTFLEKYNKELKSAKKLNPLRGYLYKEAGDLSAIDKDNESAIKLYSKALEFGEDHYFYFGIGKSYYRTNQHKKALINFSKAIDMNPEVAEYYYWRAINYLKDNNEEMALIDLKRASQLDPFNQKNNKKLSSLEKKIREQKFEIQLHHEAENKIQLLTKKINKSPNNPVLHHNRAREYHKKNQFNKALKDIKIAIELKPDEFNYYLLLDHILFAQNDLDPIISYWLRYIERNPEDSRAYSEIAGTFSHKKDLDSAIKYSKKASDLGSSEGFRAYNHFLKIKSRLSKNDK